MTPLHIIQKHSVGHTHDGETRRKIPRSKSEMKTLRKALVEACYASPPGLGEVSCCMLNHDFGNGIVECDKYDIGTFESVNQKKTFTRASFSNK